MKNAYKKIEFDSNWSKKSIADQGALIKTLGEEIRKYLDIESFVDAFIVQEFFKQVDYATSSTRFYIKDGKLYEGPVWDFDLSSGNCSSSYYKSYNNVNTTGLSWQRETLNIANGITQATTIYMKKKDIVAVLEKVMPLEIADMGNNPMTKPEFCNLKLK